MSTRLDGLGAERHGADRLHAAEAVDLVGAGQMLGGDDRRRRLALERRRAGDDARHARHLGGDHRHVRRGQQRILAARHVAADRVHRDVLVAEHDAGQRLDLDVLQRRLLVLGEIAHLRLRELDVVDVALARARRGRRGSPCRSGGSPCGPSLSNLIDISRTACVAALPRCRRAAPRRSARTLTSAASLSAASMLRLRNVAIARLL